VVAIYGDDWSSVIPYYSQRRAMMEQSFAPHDEVVRRAQSLLSPQGGYPIEAVVHCPSPMDHDPILAGILRRQLAGLYQQRIGKCEVYLTHPPASARLIETGVPRQ
jgi:hypothetical protein